MLAKLHLWMSPEITCESSRSLPGSKDEKMMHKSTGNTNKLSFGPNTFVGIAEVKLQPNSSLYALSVGYIGDLILPIKK